MHLGQALSVRALSWATVWAVRAPGPGRQQRLRSTGLVFLKKGVKEAQCPPAQQKTPVQMAVYCWALEVIEAEQPVSHGLERCWEEHSWGAGRGCARSVSALAVEHF